MKKILLLIMFLYISVFSFSEKFFGTFDAKLHQIKGDITVDNMSGAVTISAFTYDGKGSDVYIILSKDKNFKDKKKISKKETLRAKQEPPRTLPHQKASLKLPNTPNRLTRASGNGCGSTRHTRSTRNTLKILSTPVPSSRYILPLRSLNWL